MNAEDQYIPLHCKHKPLNLNNQIKNLECKNFPPFTWKFVSNSISSGNLFREKIEEN